MKNQGENIIVVTGSTGLIGDAVMRRFGRRAEDVVGFDRRAPAPPPPDCTYIPVDLTSNKSVEDGLRTVRDHHGAQLASVIHLAAYYSFSGENDPKYEEVTIKGTRRLLRGLRAGKFEVEQFVFSSTMLVHKPSEPGQLITEDSPLEPTWAYPKSKLETERLILAERGSIPAVLLRISGVYDDLCHSIPLAHQIQRIYERRVTSKLYSGETAHGQAFVHLEDLVDAIERVVELRSELPDELPLLLGEPEVLSYDELQHILGRLIHGEAWETYEVPEFVAKAGAWVQDQIPGLDPFIKPWMIDHASDHFALDISRARELLEWQPKHSLRQTLPTMVEALKTDPLRWYGENGLTPPEALQQQAARSRGEKA